MAARTFPIHILRENFLSKLSSAHWPVAAASTLTEMTEYVLKLRPGISPRLHLLPVTTYRSLEMSNGSQFEQDKRRDFASV